MEPNFSEEIEKDAEQSESIASAEAEQSEAEKTNGETPVAEKRKNPVLSFLGNWSSLIILLASVAVIVVMGVIALFLGGTIYDKVSAIWVIAFICEYFSRKLSENKSKPVLMIVCGALAVVFALLYAFQLGGILA